MVILPGGSGLCSGTVVSENAVLTAAHCALNAGLYQVITSWGTFSTSNIQHFGPGQVDDPNDIAVLWFNQAIASRSLGQVYNIGDSVSSGDTATLVGFGCDNITTKDGAGVKRMGTNVIATIDDYINFVTPNTNGAYGILGPSNRAGSCFGDSGGPALELVNGNYVVVAVTHAGGTEQDNIVSEYVNVATNSDNRGFIANLSTEYSLNINM